MEVKAHAKINWDLHILGKRPDGFHALDSVMVNVSLFDVLRLEPAERITLSCSDPTLPTDEKNLVVKAAKLLAQRSGCKQGASIHLKKAIPAGGGMGGGSSDAAATLRALNSLWQLNWDVAQLHALAAELGSDVAFFLYGGWRRCSGRGEVVEALPGSEGWPPIKLLLIMPALHVATPEVYRQLGAPSCDTKTTMRGLTAIKDLLESVHVSLHRDELPAKLGLFNGLTATAAKVAPGLGVLQQTLEQLYRGRWLMSGSGAVHFVVLGNTEEKESLTAEVRDKVGSDLRVLTATTVSALI